MLDDFFVEPGQRVVFANDQVGNYTQHYRYPYDFNLRDNTGQGALVLRLRNDSGNNNVVLLKNPAGDVVDFASWGNNSHGGYVWNKNQGSNTGAAMRRIRVDCNPDCSKPDDWVIGPRGPYAWDFYYDANGNVVLDKDLGWSMNYPAGLPFEYDERNLPVRIGNTHYRYNSAGQRYAKIHDGNITDFYVMDGDHIIAVLDSTLQVNHWTLFGNGTIGRYEPVGGGAKYFYVTDHLGSTRTVIDELGNVVQAQDYYPFGLIMPGRSFLSGTPAREGFTGKERDGETGFDYFGARYYNPALARWMNPDPLMDEYPGWSPYNYVLNNPLRLIDPDGKSANCPECQIDRPDPADLLNQGLELIASAFDFKVEPTVTVVGGEIRPQLGPIKGTIGGSLFQGSAKLSSDGVTLSGNFANLSLGAGFASAEAEVNASLAQGDLNVSPDFDVSASVEVLPVPDGTATLGPDGFQVNAENSGRIGIGGKVWTTKIQAGVNVPKVVMGSFMIVQAGVEHIVHSMIPRP